MTIPSELKRSTPRAVALIWAGWRAILWPGLVAVLIVAGMQAQQTKHATGVLFVLGWWYRNPRLALGMILFGAALGWPRYRRQTRPLMYGRAAVASVTGYEKPSYQFMRRLRVKFEFRLLSGSFRTAWANPQGAEIPDLGGEIVIVYDLDEPKRAMMYPSRTLKVDSE